jgi:hypothetical protein
LAQCISNYFPRNSLQSSSLQVFRQTRHIFVYHRPQYKWRGGLTDAMHYHHTSVHFVVRECFSDPWVTPQGGQGIRNVWQRLVVLADAVTQPEIT